MPILVDISQIAIANIMVSPDISETARDANLIKHMVFNSLRNYNVKFREEYGNMVICTDNRNYWRRDYFPHYKWSRKKNRENSGIDWETIHQTIRAVLDDLKNYFPYKFIDVEGAEADDVIAIISMNETSPTLIIGGDKDYKQLHKYAHIKQYSPRKRDFVVVDDPAKALFELVLKGDSDDGIPNIKSQSDSFVIGKRQSPMFQKDIDAWFGQAPEAFCANPQILENYQRNQTLINFDFIPKDLTQRVLEAYAVEPTKTRNDVMEYFMANKMKNLLPHAGQF